MLLNVRPLNSGALNQRAESNQVVLGLAALATSSAPDPVVTFTTATVPIVQAVSTSSAVIDLRISAVIPTVAGASDGSGQEVELQLGVSVVCDAGAGYGQGHEVLATLDDLYLAPPYALATAAALDPTVEYGTANVAPLQALGISSATSPQVLLGSIEISTKTAIIYSAALPYTNASSFGTVDLPTLQASASSSASVGDVRVTAPPLPTIAIDTLQAAVDSMARTTVIETFIPLPTVEIEMLSVYTQTSASVTVVQQSIPLPTISIAPLQAIAVSAAEVDVSVTVEYNPVIIAPLQASVGSSARVNVYQHNIALGTLRTAVPSSATDPVVVLSSINLPALSALAKSSASFVLGLSDSVVPTVTASATSAARDPVVSYSTAKVPVLQASASAAASQPQVVLGSVSINGVAFVGSSVRHSLVFGSVAVETLPATAQSAAVDPATVLSTVTVPKLQAITSSSASVEYDEATVVHTVITDLRASTTSSARVEVMLPSLALAPTGLQSYGYATVGDPLVIEGSIELTPMAAEVASSVRYDIPTLRRNLYAPPRVPSLYSITLGPSAGADRVAANMPLPEKGQSIPVRHLTSDLLKLVREGYVRIAYTLDLAQRISSQLSDLSGGVAEGAKGVDFIAVRNSIATLTAQQNALASDVERLSAQLIDLQDQLSIVLAHIDEAIPNANVTGVLNDTENMEVFDMRTE